MRARLFSKQRARIAAEDKIPCLDRDLEGFDASNAIEISHVEGIIAAEQHTIRTDATDEKFECWFRVEDSVVVQVAKQFAGRLLDMRLRFTTNLPAVLKAAGLIRHKAAAMRQANLELRMAFQNAAEHQAGTGNRRLERQAD